MANMLSNAANSAADAAALAAANPQNGTQTTNSAAMKEAYFDRCREWGEKKGSGKTSKVGMILDTAKTAWDGLIQPSKVSAGSDASKGYDGWQAGQRAKNPSKRFTGDDNSRENRISEINKYIKVGSLQLIKDVDMGGYGVLKRAHRIIEDSLDIKGEVEDLISKVATAQLRNPAVPLTDDEIIGACAPKPKREQSEADLWGNVRTQIDSIIQKFPDAPLNLPRAAEDLSIKTARQAVQNRIDQLGGTAAEIAKREAEAAKKAKLGTPKKGKKRR